MSGTPLSTHELRNGLSLVCIDRSRKIAADRWYVEIVARIEIPVDMKWFQHVPVDAGKFQDIRQVLGETLFFEQKTVRNFVSDAVKKAIVADICVRIAAVGNQYYSHPDFPSRYILKCFGEQMKNRH